MNRSQKCRYSAIVWSAKYLITNNLLSVAILLLAGFSVLFSCKEPQAQPIGFLLGKPAPPPLDSNLQAFLDEYERYFADSVRLTNTPGAAVVVVKDSQLVLVRGFGVKSVGSLDAVDENTVFRIGSLSKGFAGVLAGILVQKGYLRWNDAVQQYCPEFELKDKAQASRVRLWHLLSHTTGLPYHAFDHLIEQGFDREAIAQHYFKTSKLFGKEGEFYGYQNAAFSMVEPMMQAATERDYHSLLKEYIFEPAGMSSTLSDFYVMRAWPNKALPHRYTEVPGWVADTVSTRFFGFPAAGGLCASAKDMGAWLKVLLGNHPEIVSDTTLDRIFTPVVKTGREKRTLPGLIDRDSAHYAMGWRILQHDSTTLVYHAGFVNNYHCEIAFDRRDKIGVCILMNAPTQMAGTGVEAFFRRWWQSKYKAPLKSTAPPPPLMGS